MQGRPLNPQMRREILRLAALRSIDGRQLWTYAAISRQLGLDGRTVGKVVRDAWQNQVDTPRELLDNWQRIRYDVDR